MQLDLWLRREAQKRRKEILAASEDPELVKSANGYMRDYGYKPDGPMRQSEVTGDWYQWWHLTERAPSQFTGNGNER